jgi:hypothetical protein
LEKYSNKFESEIQAPLFVGFLPVFHLGQFNRPSLQKLGRKWSHYARCSFLTNSPDWMLADSRRALEQRVLWIQIKRKVFCECASQGCQTVYFQIKKSNLGNFWGPLIGKC